MPTELGDGTLCQTPLLCGSVKPDTSIGRFVKPDTSTERFSEAGLHSESPLQSFM